MRKRIHRSLFLASLQYRFVTGRNSTRDNKLGVSEKIKILTFMKMLRLDENYLNFNIRILTIFGMWNPYYGVDDINGRIYSCYAVGLFCFAGMMQTMAEAIHAWKNRKDVVLFTQHFTLFTGMASTMMKIVNLWRRKDNVEEMIELLNHERRQPCNRKFAIYRDEKITSTIRACKILSLTFIIMVFWYAVFIYGKILVYDKGIVDMLPLSPVFPLRTDHSSYYWLLFFFDEATFFYVAGTVASHDAFFMVFLIHLAAQLDLLKQRLKSCLDKTDDTNDEDYIEVCEKLDDLKIEWVSRTSVQELMVDPLTEMHICIQHHQKILRYASLVRIIFNQTLLLQFASSLLMITMIGFQIIGERKMSSNEFIETVTLLMCALFQLFLYCWFGTDIIAKSENISSSAYHSKWYLADKRFKNSLKILLLKGQIPIKFRVGSVGELSSTTFMNIISKCYSSMALLQQVNE